ncbi:S41 family peptidase [Chitinophaga caeni]|uniref:S41 family peptidase n=1 Tax=Chitinophaga caeni TaxID=2029983 RepID=UPI0012FE31A8|nr:S41 family peptidase [Chitinophaga caeni]
MKINIQYRLFLGCLLLFLGCSKDQQPDPFPDNLRGNVNRWILDSLHRYYYWSDEITKHVDPNLEPVAYFEQLLSPKDRFSWISNRSNHAPKSNSFFIYGFHYAIVSLDELNGEYLAVITDVNPSGAANAKGLKRGDCFIAVNGIAINQANITQVNKILNDNDLNTLELLPVQLSDPIDTLPAIQLNRGYAGADAIRFTRIFKGNAKTTGYLYYTSFDENYDGLLINAFSKLKEAGANELILDLRYNAGGSVATAAKLATLITGELQGQDVFAVYAGNKYEGTHPQKLNDVLSTSSNNLGKQYSQLAPYSLKLQRVFILTTGGTVSASELLINNLKPYLQVVQIGSTTEGKDEASFLIKDVDNDLQDHWQMQPTVYKLLNARMQGAYDQGIAPTYTVNELSKLPLAALDSEDDPLLLKALQLIYGSQFPWPATELKKVGAGKWHTRTLFESSAKLAQESSVLLIPKPGTN